MRDIKKILEKSAALPPQSKVDLVRGMSVHRTKGGIAVLSIHYSGDPDRDPAIHPEWKQRERKTYSSQAAWDREQEMIDEAGGGELVFADTLLTYWNKIVITDPGWRPSPHWRVEAGFDHGKTNPTALLRAYIDGDGVIYFCGEYYVPGKEVWEHVGELRRMPDIRRVSACYADPSMFDCTMQQSINPTNTLTVRGSAKSINDLYVEQGIELFSPFALDRSDVGFAARLMLHWSNLDTREPTIKIVCRNRSEQPQYGLHPWDCPNLLWELMRTRREKLTAQQLLTRNVSERIVDKDNHARDAMKYLVMSLPEPAMRTPGSSDCLYRLVSSSNASREPITRILIPRLPISGCFNDLILEVANRLSNFFLNLPINCMAHLALRSGLHHFGERSGLSKDGIANPSPSNDLDPNASTWRSPTQASQGIF